MASVTKHPQTASLSPLSRPEATPSSQTADIAPRSHADSGLSSLADAGLKASPLKSNPLLRGYQAPALTGAAAMADEERASEKRSQPTSINPAFNAANIFARDPNAQMSRAADAPTQAQASALSVRETSPLTAEPMQIDGQLQSDAGSFKQPGDPSSNVSARSGHDGALEERSNKAFSYPPRPDQIPDRSETNRQMSLPNPNSSRTSSGRKHRCPHCLTEFTRHHNLKSHLLTHSHEKPFACSDCNQKFRRLHDLKRHTKLHTGERPHVCEKCNRSFARGDALARHSKGPGGCAGRRNSGGEDDDGDLGSRSMIDPGMDGIAYDQDDEAQQGDPKRRKSAPDHNRKRSLQVTNSTSQNSRQTSTYPPVAPHGRSAHHGDGTFQAPTHLSPRMAGGTGQHVQPFSSASFSHGGMTESPGPLSPGTAETRRLSAGLPPPRARSPSLATSLAQQHISRGSQHGSPHLNLPASQMSHTPQLPSITGLGPENRQRTSHPSPTNGVFASGAGRGPPTISTTNAYAGANGPSNAASPQTGGAATQQRMSGANLREVSTGTTQEDWFREYVRKTEAEKQGLRDQLSAQQARFETAIAELRGEIAGLKGQRSAA